MIRNKKGPSALQHQQQRAQTTPQDILLPSTRDSIQQNTEHTRDSSHNSFSDQQQSPLPTALTTTLPVSQYGNTTQYHNRYQSTLREHTIENTGLTMVLERMRRCFWDRMSNHHIDMLSMCLSNIFISVDELYRILLPELTTCLQRNPIDSEEPITETTGAETTRAETTRAETSNAPTDHYCIWSLLQDIENALEHLEPLCHLLINTITTTVEALDRSCSIYGAARIKRQLLREGEDEESTEILAAISTAHISDHTYYHWMQAVRSLSEQLQQWQYCNQTRCSFAEQFDLFATMIPTLGQLDSMLDLIVDTMQAIFGQILPEFHMIARGDDETATTLLLDVTQKIDLILLTIHTQIEPLYILTREYAHKIKLQ